ASPTCLRCPYTTLFRSHPWWCREAVVTINGKRRIVSRKPSSYISIERQWRNGDVVEVHLPMHLHAEPLPGEHDRSEHGCDEIGLDRKSTRLNSSHVKNS